MNLNKIVMGALIAAGLTTAVVWQFNAHRRLAAENVRWRAQAAALERSRLDGEALRTNTDSAQLERLRAEHNELLRLRGEVASLRTQVRDATNAMARLAAAERARRASSSTNAEVLRPVISYQATAAAHIPTGHALLTGGWMTQEGKRVLVMLSSEVVNSATASQILLQAKWVEMPDDVFSALGLDALKTGATETTLNQVMDDPQYRALVHALEDKAGVDLLSAPRVVTSDGVAAQVSVTERKVIDGESFDVGPTLDLIPRIAADKNGIDVDVRARLDLLRKP